MEIKMKMPDLATTDSAIKVIRWLVTPGQPIQRGQALLEVETDKATMEVECIATGIFKEPRAQPGDTLLAGQILAVIEVQGPPRPTSAEPTAVAEAMADKTAGRPAPEDAPSAPAPSPSSVQPIEIRNSKFENPPKAGGMFAKNRAAANRPSQS
ncbi:MAG: 2-oxoglutarate dehydrogenase E2 component (dihydrolipoamide succinyltransferase) [Verrucomicrobia bacterium]|nr:MAG: 2-oxoglutarate dehydrogenase E2 component (dihydrolipoamide succinyltransferase) [Verrucomicrobiota bacterium]